MTDVPIISSRRRSVSMASLPPTGRQASGRRTTRRAVTPRDNTNSFASQSSFHYQQEQQQRQHQQPRLSSSYQPTAVNPFASRSEPCVSLDLSQQRMRKNSDHDEQKNEEKRGARRSPRRHTHKDADSNDSGAIVTPRRRQKMLAADAQRKMKPAMTRGESESVISVRKSRRRSVSAAPSVSPTAMSMSSGAGSNAQMIGHQKRRTPRQHAPAANVDFLTGDAPAASAPHRSASTQTTPFSSNPFAQQPRQSMQSMGALPQQQSMSALPQQSFNSMSTLPQQPMQSMTQQSFNSMSTSPQQQSTELFGSDPTLSVLQAQIAQQQALLGSMHESVQKQTSQLAFIQQAHQQAAASSSKLPPDPSRVSAAPHPFA
jgi:hypothetical protein